MFRKLKKILLPVALAFIVTLFTSAQEALKLSLDKSIKMALQNNTNIINSKLDMEIAQKRIWEITATGLPHIDAKSSYQHLFKVPVLNFPGTQLSHNNVTYNPNTGVGTLSPLTLSTGETIYLNSTAGTPIELGIANNISTDITVSQLIFSGSYIYWIAGKKSLCQSGETKR